MEDPVLIKFLVLKCVKKYFNWELLLRHGNLLNIKAYKYQSDKTAVYVVNWQFSRHPGWF